MNKIKSKELKLRKFSRKFINKFIQNINDKIFNKEYYFDTKNKIIYIILKSKNKLYNINLKYNINKKNKNLIIEKYKISLYNLNS